MKTILIIISLILISSGCDDDSNNLNSSNNTNNANNTNNLLCGNGNIDGQEECDGLNIDGENCESLGYLQADEMSQPICNNDCTFNTITCWGGKCGNAIVENGESCDGEFLSDETCESLGFAGGTLGCSCPDFDTSECLCESQSCGDGVLDAGEECDGSQMGEASCQSLGYSGGTLGCENGCSFDLANCTYDAISDLSEIKEISSSRNHTCFIDSQQKVWCFGDNITSKIGVKEFLYLLNPVPTIGDLQFTSHSNSSNHHCAIDASGGAWCWGYTESGELGNTESYEGLVEYYREFAAPVNGNHVFSKITVGGFTFEMNIYGHTCAIDQNGAAWCWGSNIKSQLGQGNTGGSSSLPVAVVDGHEFTDIASGGQQTCALDNTGSTWCWGEGPINYGYSPHEVASGHEFISITSGGYIGQHFCGHKSDGSVWCWGYNLFGQLGNTTSGVDSEDAIEVSGNHVFERISAGAFHTCGVDISGTLWCWGYNHDGQIGNGTTTDTITPVQVNVGQTITQVACGEKTSCALDNSGGIWCWGINFGSSPTKISGSDTFVSIGGSCAIDSNGLSWCWGDNATGQAGSFNYDMVPFKYEVPTSESFVDVIAGRMHSCGVKSDGTVWCWGSNANGQFGSDTLLMSSPIPVQIPGVENIVSIKRGGDYTICGVNSSGQVYCWGENLYPVTRFFDSSEFPLITATKTTAIDMRGHLLSETLDRIYPQHTFRDMCVNYQSETTTYLDTNGSAWVETGSCLRKIITDSKVSRLACGVNEICLVTITGELLCGFSEVSPVSFGENLLLTPSVGGDFKCALNDVFEVWCWGQNFYGELGNGSRIDSQNPVEVISQDDAEQQISSWLP
jgi:alpha-tubulin suppressor-like RCC1 family protein